WVEDGLLDVLEREGVGSIAFSPLAGGLLTGKYINGIPADSRAAGKSQFLSERDLTEEKLAVIKQLGEVARSRGQSLTQMSLAWVLRGGRVTSALIGASRPAQIEENVATLANLDFSPEELRQIEQILTA
ncbi:MAG: aldo/keto reductase, partial [Eubacteriales bacterium]|nr:aldo/keto reductase [Eubacteriales bacterium]